jgi:hypothetical protein
VLLKPIDERNGSKKALRKHFITKIAKNKKRGID